MDAPGIGINFRIDRDFIDPRTGEFKERTSPDNVVNRDSRRYLLSSINRLSIISDRPIRNKTDICNALKQYGFCLSDEQRQVLVDYCQ